MSDANIKAAANNLVRAASHKREEQKKLLAEADNVQREYEKLQRAKKDEIHEHEILAAANPKPLKVAYDLTRIHQSKNEISKAHEQSKQKIAELQTEAERLAADANYLEHESHELDKNA